MRIKLVFAVLFLLIALCIYLIFSYDTGVNADSELRQAYTRAIEDAKTAEECKIYRNLTVIADSNKDLIWSNNSSETLVLVVTWTAWDGYLNKTVVNTSKEIWVTTAPQLNEFITQNNISGQKCVLRLEQLLGLPPHNGKKWFVEIWVNPKDLFRPTPDQEINDSEAQLDFPPNTSIEYQQWFNQLKNTSYGTDGYPWTRLGYTYDWGNPQSEIGLSEFVIKKDAEIRINKINPNTEYCPT